MKIHIVKKGETLGKIAKMYHMDVQKLLAVNPHVKDPDHILPRTKVKVPTAGVPLKPKRTMASIEENQWQPASHTENDGQSPAVKEGVAEKETLSATMGEGFTQERDATLGLESAEGGLSDSDIPPYYGQEPYMQHYAGYMPNAGYVPGYAPGYLPGYVPYTNYMPYASNASYAGNAPYMGYSPFMGNEPYTGYDPYASGGWTESSLSEEEQERQSSEEEARQPAEEVQGVQPVHPYVSGYSYDPYHPYSQYNFNNHYASPINWVSYYPTAAAWHPQQTFYAHPVQRMYHLPDWWNPGNTDGEDSGEEG